MDSENRMDGCVCANGARELEHAIAEWDRAMGCDE